MAGSKITAYYVASTHWDREWYEPFQAFRYYLVHLMEEVLETMGADARYACFQTDGQSIIVEDYLEILPEREARVRELAKQGRLRIGPWYSMPDEFLVTGESLIRNLEEGLRVARDFGNASHVGFICDMFGHTSQMPQILMGFDIETAYLYRGVNEDKQKGLFRWQGPDGSEVVTFRFGPQESYFDFAAHVRKAYEHETPYDKDAIVTRLIDYVHSQRERVGIDHVLLFDGGDHMPIEPRICDVLDAVRARTDDIEVRHVGLGEFAAALVKHREQIERISRGELRDPGRLYDGNWVIPGVLSSRIRLKQSNRARETELCAWAEPFSVFAHLLAGHTYPHGFLRRSWRLLMENHAHDSICGCSPDQIHKDMEFRFDQSRLINGKLIRYALEAIAARVDVPDQAGENYAMVVFNPTQHDIDGPVDLELWFDENTKSLFAEFFKFEWKVGFRIYDADDNELPYDFVGYHPQRRRFHRPWGKVSMGQECIVVKVTTPLKIPACGYTTLTVKPTDEHTRHPVRSMVTADRTIENEHLRVTVENNGALTVHDKRTKQTYDRQLVFENRADIGDGWYHGVAANDRIFSSTACAADVAVVVDGDQKATLRITNRMEVPREFEWGLKMRRSDATETLLIETDVTLRRGGEEVELCTRLDNNIRDHRLRVLFETRAATDTYLSDQAFDVVERKIGLPATNHTFKELAVETTPQQNWTAVFDERRGLAVVSPGLQETAVRDLPDRTLALTLLRGFRRTIFTNTEEGGQSLGAHEFHYRLVPLAGRPDPAVLHGIAQRVMGGVRATEVLRRLQVPQAERTLPRTHGMLKLAPGRAWLSMLRQQPAGDLVELRLCNVADEAVQETLTFDRELAEAALYDLNGKQLQGLPVKGKELSVPVGPRKFVTVGVRFGVR